MSEPPTVTSESAIAGHDGERVRLVGRYEQQDVRMRQTPPPVHRGHAAVVLDDGTAVLLEPIWKPEALRAQDEIARLDGKRVAAIGVLHAEAPDSPEGTANLRAPCLTPVESIAPSP